MDGPDFGEFGWQDAGFFLDGPGAPVERSHLMAKATALGRPATGTSNGNPFILVVMGQQIIRPTRRL